MQKLSETKCPKATDEQKKTLLSNPKGLETALLDAPVALEEAVIYAIIDDVAYPLYELAVSIKSQK